MEHGVVKISIELQDGVEKEAIYEALIKALTSIHKN